MRAQLPIQIPVRKMNEKGAYQTKNGQPEHRDMTIIPDLPIMFGLPQHQLYATKVNVVQASEINPIRTAHDSLVKAVLAFVQLDGQATAHIHLNGDVSFVMPKHLEAIPFIHSALVHILDCAGYSVSLDLPAVPLFNGNAAFMAGEVDGEVVATSPVGWSRSGHPLQSTIFSHLEMMISLMALTLRDTTFPRGQGKAVPTNDIRERYDKATRVHRPDEEVEENVETTALPNIGKPEIEDELDGLVAMDDDEGCEAEDDWDPTDEEAEEERKPDIN